ncbi:MAG: DUF2865 domain-containing protein [Roseibium sp.]|uniref:DUF2865 domain-containing protein n=1 Tax=Roseibium sp. TaxID=1936156 RepID=UPI002624919E|nr:DUF2865 domain-containing protein [Roseibium sp.]MCV0427453.1 DUF2865 domain-containing protein [Roseibium sp.]
MGLCKTRKSVSLMRILTVCAVFVLPAATVEAASCSSLKSELRRLEAGSGKQSPAAQKWTSARKQQQNAISAAERDARFFNCSSVPSAKCQGLNSKIKRMKANLAAIERQLAKSGGGSNRNSKRIRQVRGALEKQNCNAAASTRQAKAENRNDNQEPRGFLQRLFTPKTSVEQVSATTGDREISTVRSSSRRSTSRLRIPSGGTFRTLCVRTCDGYFFPVSYSTGKSQFVNDEARCTEICPAAETELYVHRNPGGDQSKMLSLAGELYSEQPFAYRYKSEYVEGCSCRLTKQNKTQSSWTELSTASGNRVFLSDISSGLPRRTLQPSRGNTFEKDDTAPSPLSRTPLHKAQLPFYEDPGTLFNLEKGFNVATSLDEVSKKLKGGTTQLVEGALTESGLPLLTNRSLSKDGEVEAASTSPIFKHDDSGFRPAPDRETPVRVVGPEFFVAQ